MATTSAAGFLWQEVCEDEDGLGQDNEYLIPPRARRTSGEERSPVTNIDSLWTLVKLEYKYRLLNTLNPARLTN